LGKRVELPLAPGYSGRLASRPAAAPTAGYPLTAIDFRCPNRSEYHPDPSLTKLETESAIPFNGAKHGGRNAKDSQEAGQDGCCHFVSGIGEQAGDPHADYVAILTT